MKSQLKLREEDTIFLSDDIDSVVFEKTLAKNNQSSFRSFDNSLGQNEMMEKILVFF